MTTDQPAPAGRDPRGLNAERVARLQQANPFDQVYARLIGLDEAERAADDASVWVTFCPQCHTKTLRVTDRAAACQNCFHTIGDVIELVAAHMDIPPDQAMRFLERAPTNDPAHYNTVDDRPPDPDTAPPFRVLGHFRNTFYYHPRGTKEIISLTAAQHTQANLLGLAPLSHWQEHFEHKTKHFDVLAAADALMRRAEKVGVFDVERLRGRGAWIEKGRPVVHLGNVVWKDGAKLSPADATDFYIYEAGLPLDIDIGQPASNAEAFGLVRIMKQFDWLDPISAYLISGWIIISTVCGALRWRPHIWIAGPSQSGKSTVLEILKRVVGPIAEPFDGGTSEAGVRQTLYHDARPGIFDEFESESQAAAELVQRIMALARVASGGGKITKGSAKGDAVHHTVRAMFAFCSINPAIVEYADERRISRLVLRKPIGIDEEREERYKNVLADIAATITADYAARMFARTLLNLPTLLKNVRTFTDAASFALRNRGAADQLAPMLAGAYLCHSTKEITYDEALAWIRKHRWSEHTAMDETQDPLRLISQIAISITRVTTTMSGIKDYTVGELIELGMRGRGDGIITHAEVVKVLGRIGIKVADQRHFSIINKSPELRRILRGTPWAGDWRTTLRGLDCASPADPMQYSPGLHGRGTMLTRDVLRGRINPPDPSQGELMDDE